MRAVLFTAAATATAVVAIGAPAHAISASGRGSVSPGEDASMCFGVSPMLSAGVATATGLVTTEPVPALSLEPSFEPERKMVSAPTTLVSDVRPLATTAGYSSVCVGGAGGRAIAGSAVFTLNLHGTQDDYVVVVQCTYRPDVAPLCFDA